MTFHCRKNVATMTSQEKQRFRNAVFRLHEQGRYQAYVQFHGLVSNLGHFGPAFLAWHRVMMRTFEEELQSVDAGVTLPYWDFTSSNEDPDNPGQSLIWNSDLFGGNGSVTLNWTGQDSTPKSWTITRRNFNVLSVPVSPNSVADAIDENTYQDPTSLNTNAAPRNGFREALEHGAHGSAHVWLGVPGDQGSFATAVNDPFFMMLHANIDRLWTVWQQRMKEAWIAANPGVPYPAGQPAADYHYDGLTPNTSWPTPANRHHLDDDLWPWDGTEAQPGTAASAFSPWKDGMPVSYTPRMVLNSVDYGGYLYDTDDPHVEPVTSNIVFNSVPEGQTTVRAAVFSVKSCGQTATLQITSGPGAGFSTPFSNTDVFDPDVEGSEEGEARIWIAFTGTSAGAVANGSVTIRCLETTEQWTLPITAMTIAKPTVATALVLDRSGSMNLDAGLGNGQRRIDVLKQSAPVFVDLMETTDGVGVASFSGNATIDMVLQPAGAAPFGVGRANAKAAIQSLAPGGSTSIGDGVEAGHNIVTPAPGYDHQAIVVLTDGYENTPKYIADVAGMVNSRVFAIGVGTPDQLNPGALDDLTDGTGGYLMMTGTPAVDFFRLSKYFLQILAGVQNHQIVLDPDGRLAVGDTHRIPFQLNDSDIGADVVVLLPHRGGIGLALETPSGQLVEANALAGTAGYDQVVGDNVTYWRVRLPAVAGGAKAHGGTWHAVLRTDRQAQKDLERKLADRPKELRELMAHGIPYSLLVTAESNLDLQTKLTQERREPGAQMLVAADLTEFGIPLRGRASVTATVEDPKGNRQRLRFRQVDQGRFLTDLQTTLSGTYTIRVRARGLNHRGQPFTREQLVTGSVWRRSEKDPPRGDDRLPLPDGEEPDGRPTIRVPGRRPGLTIDPDVLRRGILRRFPAGVEAILSEALVAALRTPPDDDG